MSNVLIGQKVLDKSCTLAVFSITDTVPESSISCLSDDDRPVVPSPKSRGFSGKSTLCTFTSYVN